MKKDEKEDGNSQIIYLSNRKTPSYLMEEGGREEEEGETEHIGGERSEEEEREGEGANLARRSLSGEIVISRDGIICDHNFAYINVLV